MFLLKKIFRNAVFLYSAEILKGYILSVKVKNTFYISKLSDIKKAKITKFNRSRS